MQQLRRLMVVAGLCAPLLVAHVPQNAPSTWPALFPGAKDAPIIDADWDEAKAGAAGVAFRVPHPRTWTVAGSNTYLLGIKSPNGRHFVQISQPRALPVPIPLPFPVAQLQQATESLSRVIATHDFTSIGGGQASVGGRWWLWQDQMMPTSAASRLSADFREALTAEFDTLRLWIFVTNVNRDAVMVFCWALVPRGLSDADLERELRPAAAVFDRMIKRMVLRSER